MAQSMHEQALEQNAAPFAEQSRQDIGVDLQWREKPTDEELEGYCYDLLSAVQKLHCHDNFYSEANAEWVNHGTIQMQNLLQWYWNKTQMMEYGPEYRKNEPEWAPNQRKNSLRFVQKTDTADDEPTMGGVLQRYLWADDTLEKAKMPQAAKKTTQQDLDFKQGRVAWIHKQLTTLSIRIEERHKNYAWMKKAFAEIASKPYVPYKASTPDPELPERTMEQRGLDRRIIDIIDSKSVE